MFETGPTRTSLRPRVQVYIDIKKKKQGAEVAAAAATAAFARIAAEFQFSASEKNLLSSVFFLDRRENKDKERN